VVPYLSSDSCTPSLKAVNQTGFSLVIWLLPPDMPLLTFLPWTLPFLAVVEEFTSEVKTHMRQAGGRMVVVVVIVIVVVVVVVVM